jgi:RNA polymerase sigma factor (sigma-70 family)
MARSKTTGVARRIHVLFQAESLVGLSDGQLLERFLADRDEASELAFTALVQRHGTMVLGVCRRILDDPEEAEDASQATFLVLIRKARSIRVEGSVGRWLYGVATRVAARGRARIRRRAARETGGVELLIAPTSTPPSEAEELRAVLAQELSRLPVRFQMPVAPCVLEGLTHEEAALRLGLPVGTIKSRMSRARRRLQEQARVPDGRRAADSPRPRRRVHRPHRRGESREEGANDSPVTGRGPGQRAQGGGRGFLQREGRLPGDRAEPRGAFEVKVIGFDKPEAQAKGYAPMIFRSRFRLVDGPARLSRTA